MTVANVTDHFKPPSIVLKELFHNSVRNISDDFIKNAAKSVLLPPTETCFWLEHLQTFVDNRCSGAAKAAATRRARSKKNMANTQDAKQVYPEDQGRYFCATCGVYEEEAEQGETWIGCDLCDAWYHTDCENLKLFQILNVITISLQKRAHYEISAHPPLWA